MTLVLFAPKKDSVRKVKYAIEKNLKWQTIGWIRTENGKDETTIHSTVPGTPNMKAFPWHLGFKDENQATFVGYSKMELRWTYERRHYIDCH